ncbi:MAG TPA: hypothetical protein VEX62_10030 [Candidatus Limnocylindrales bacterium]|nr:hypothetical protein [Candidatus Limnocylindrales bacterium]
MPRAILLVLLCGAALLGGCYEEPVAITTFPPTDPPTPTSQPTPSPTVESTPTPAPTLSPTLVPTITPSPSPSPTPSPTAQASASIGEPAADCVNGWIGTLPNSAEYAEGIAILEGHMGISGPWVVTDMRYFDGPEAPWILEPEYDSVERWYVKASLADDAAFRGRWLLEKRTELIRGVSAVASYSSAGYASPDWTGFVGEGPPTTYLGLPGAWSGIPYDFVTGEGDSGNPGLPDEVVGCMTGT